MNLIERLKALTRGHLDGGFASVRDDWNRVSDYICGFFNEKIGKSDNQDE